jgi:UDP-N-acetyl-D-glucosamine dehydrogenase
LTIQVAVIGLGYVGLPLAVAAAQEDYIVNGIDINEEKIAQLGNGVSIIEDISSADISKLINNKFLTVSSNFSKVKDSQIVLICVPTPLNENHKPDLSYVEDAVKSNLKL